MSDGLYRRPRSPFYWCSFVYEGERHQVSTRETDRERAAAFLRARRETGPIFPKSGIFERRYNSGARAYWIAFYDAEGKRVREPAGTTIDGAVALKSQREDEVANGRHRPRPRRPVRLRSPRELGFLYAIHGGGLTKFGWARNPTRRLAQFQTGCPVQLSLVAVVPGSFRDEHALHRWAGADRLHGEWFRVSSKDAALALARFVPSSAPPRGATHAFDSLTVRRMRRVSGAASHTMEAA